MRVNEVAEELGVSVPYAYKLIRELNEELRKTGCIRRNRCDRRGKERSNMKTVQIPYGLFLDLAMYHLRGEDEYEDEICRGLEQKLDAMLNRQLYSRYKTAPTEEEREQARQEYLDRRGVPQSYRWTVPPWEL